MSGKPNPPKEYAKECTGRPSKFTPERRAAIIHAISKRCPYEFAAEGNGISETTLYEWLAKGKADRNENIESEYSIFADGIKNAEMSRIIDHAENIAQHVEKWQGDAWMLERRWHKHFSTNAGLNELNSKLDKLMDGEKKNDQQNERKNEKNVEEE